MAFFFMAFFCMAFFFVLYGAVRFTRQGAAKPVRSHIHTFAPDPPVIIRACTSTRPTRPWSVVKGVVEITPRFENVFVLVCDYNYATSKLCQGMCHHYGARHVSPRLQHSPVSTMGTSAAAGSVLPHQRLRQPDSALRAFLLACRLDLRQARFRASRRVIN